MQHPKLVSSHLTRKIDKRVPLSVIVVELLAGFGGSFSVIALGSRYSSAFILAYRCVVYVDAKHREVVVFRRRRYKDRISISLEDDADRVDSFSGP